MFSTELSIDIPPESPLASSKRSKKRKAKDGGAARDKKPKRSRPKAAAKGEKAAETSYDDGSDGDEETVEVCFFGSLNYGFLLFLVNVKSIVVR